MYLHLNLHLHVHEHVRVHVYTYTHICISIHKYDTYIPDCTPMIYLYAQFLCSCMYMKGKCRSTNGGYIIMYVYVSIHMDIHISMYMHSFMHAWMVVCTYTHAHKRRASCGPSRWPALSLFRLSTWVQQLESAARLSMNFPFALVGFRRDFARGSSATQRGDEELHVHLQPALRWRSRAPRLQGRRLLVPRLCELQAALFSGSAPQRSAVEGLSGR